MLFRHDVPCALIFALDKAGRSKPASMAIIAITTSNSIKVKPFRLGTVPELLKLFGIFILNLFLSLNLFQQPTHHWLLEEDTSSCFAQEFIESERGRSGCPTDRVVNGSDGIIAGNRTAKRTPTGMLLITGLA
jgi:hypothetical protein